MSGSQTQNYGTTVTAGGNATLAALGGDLKAAGATLTSEGATTLLAGKSLDLGAVTNNESESLSGSKNGFLTHSSFSNSQSSSTDVGTTVAAGTNLTAVSGGDMHVAGMVGGGGDVSLQSGGAFTESALHSTSSESSSHHVAGFHMSTQGASGTVGYGSRTDTQSASSSTYTPSVVASTGGSLSISANGPVTIDGSVVAAAKDLGISGSSVAFTTEQNSTTQTAMHKDKSIGVTGGISPDSMVGQAINGALGAKSSGTGVQSALAGIQTGLGEGMSALGGATTNNIIGGQVSVGFSSNKSRSGETRTTVQGSTASAGGTLAIEARGDNTTDKNNGDLSATAAHLSGQDVALAAQNGITLNSGVNTDHTEATSSSKSASVGVEASVGTTGNVGVSVTASASASHQHSASDSTTNVDTTVSATNSVSLTTPGTTTLNGAEVDGERVSVKAGAISSTADASLNHFHTQSLDTTGEDNQSIWSGTSVAAGGGFSTAGSLADAAKTVTVAVGHVDHTETTTTDSVITGNIGVESGNSTGSYSTDLTAANGHLSNDFNATKVNNTLQTEIGAETAAETAVEVGMQAYNRWRPSSEPAGVSDQKTSSSVDAQTIQQAEQDGYVTTSDGRRLSVHKYGTDTASFGYSEIRSLEMYSGTKNSSVYSVDSSTGMPAVNDLYWNNLTGQSTEMPLSSDQYSPASYKALHENYGSIIASVPLNAQIEGGSPTNTTIVVPDDGTYHATGLANSAGGLLFSKEGASDYYIFTDKGINNVTGTGETAVHGSGGNSSNIPSGINTGGNRSGTGSGSITGSGENTRFISDSNGNTIDLSYLEGLKEVSPQSVDLKLQRGNPEYNPYGQPNTYVNSGNGHAIVFGPEGKALYDISSQRIKLVKYNINKKTGEEFPNINGGKYFLGNKTVPESVLKILGIQ